MRLTVRGVLLGTVAASDVVLDAGKVVSVKRAGQAAPDIGSQGSIIAPTLFDTQVNGLRGIDLHSETLSPEDIKAMTDLLAQWGVSHWIPTLVTGAQSVIERNCAIVREALQDKTVARAVPGLHIEGPYISPLDGPRGAHPKEHVRNPSLREFDRLLKAVDGKILYTTLAPELPGALAYIKGVVRRGVIASLGHHAASATHISHAVDAGARYCTHLGNGLASQIQRHTNPLWPQLADDRLMAGLIPDLEHLPPAALKTFVRAKRPENVVFTSDAVHVALLGPGRYAFAGSEVDVLPTGRVCLSGTDLLAGSALMLLQGVVNAARVTDMNLVQAFASATTIPAQLFGLRHRFALPEPGRKAEFVVFDVSETGKMNLRAVFVNGERRR